MRLNENTNPAVHRYGLVAWMHGCNRSPANRAKRAGPADREPLTHNRWCRRFRSISTADSSSRLTRLCIVVWSEMPDVRKFYFPISSRETEQPARRSGGPFRMPLRKWRAVGCDEIVAMDKKQPFVGEQSPRIQLDPSSPHGIRQSGLVKSNKYTGRIYLPGTPGAKVKVSLIWGHGANDRQTISFASLTDAHKRFRLSFTANGDAADRALEITGTGSGDFHWYSRGQALRLRTCKRAPGRCALGDRVHGRRRDLA